MPQIDSWSWANGRETGAMCSGDVGDSGDTRFWGARYRLLPNYSPGNGDGTVMEILPRTVPASSWRIASRAWLSM